jgi:hypothetical protein
MSDVRVVTPISLLSVAVLAGSDRRASEDEWTAERLRTGHDRHRT